MPPGKRGRVAARLGNPSSGPAVDRALRQKNQTTLSYFADSDSDEDGPGQNYSLEEKLASKKFPKYMQYFVKELKGDEVNLAYFQRSGFNTPIFIKEKDGLGMTVPDSNFSVTDVKTYVGPKRMIDVMDCSTQKNSEMSMKEWEEYYTSPNRTKKLNVISLEFSYTKLEPHVIAPKVVRQIDWIDSVWPRHLKEDQTETTNDMRFMKYPKVQKYCLMSVKGCFTDFHIDFGGTSVWYHIIKGKKVFWLIPPTETNLKTYENWTLSGRQGDVFFGDIVEKCGMITLEAGNTFFIPSGWIHAVFTPEDSLVFGGNFLHSFAIEKQIRVAQIEEMTKVPQKFRFPFFTELQWYALDKYVYALLGRSHLEFDEDTKLRLLGTADERKHFKDALAQSPRHITPQEIFGLKAIIMYIHALAVSKKNVPYLLRHPINLVRDVRVVVDSHKEDDPAKAVTGQPLLFWPGIKHDPGYAKTRGVKGSKKGRPQVHDEYTYTPIKDERGEPVKIDRIPCKICQACIRPDCTKCETCYDMIRYGGPGRLRRPCRLRQCIQPLLPNGVCCHICDLDGWYAEPNMRLVDRPPGTCALMECKFCLEVTHPTCLTDYGVEGFIRIDLPNSWECPKCVKNGVKSEEDEGGDATDGPSPSKIPKTEPGTVEQQNQSQYSSEKIPIASGTDANMRGYQLFSVKGQSDQPKHELRTQLAEQILAASSHPMRMPKYVVRPPPKTEEMDHLFKMSKDQLLLERVVMLGVFQRLPTTDLANCSLVCKDWNSILQDPSLWSSVKLVHWKITSHLLSLIVKRQPLKLGLDFCTVSKQQLSWLLPRIPQTRALSLCGLDFGSAITALASVNTPMFQELDLSFVTGFSDAALFKILSSPRDSRPGLLDKKSRLKFLRKLDLSGTQISDVSLRYVAQYLAQLLDLKVSKCWKISDAGLAQLAPLEHLATLDLSGCKMITNQGLLHLAKGNKSLYKVDCNGTSATIDGLKKFIEVCSEKKLKLYGHVVDRKQSGRK